MTVATTHKTIHNDVHGLPCQGLNSRDNKV